MTIPRTLRLPIAALLAAAALAGCSRQAPERPAAQAPSALFPDIADGAFYPVRCAGPDAGDVALDPVTGNVDRDLIGDATYPAFYRYADATDVYFRMRIDGKPTKANGSLQPSSYDILIDTDGNLDTYEYMLTADGNLGSGGKVLWVRNSIQTPSDPTDAANDQAGDVLADLTPASDYYAAKQTTDGSNFNGTPDWFITLRVPKTLLAAVGIDLSKSFVVWAGTNARNYSLNADFGCFVGMPATLSQAASMPVNLDPDGQPTAADDIASTNEDSAAIVSVLANDTGLRDTPITVSVSTPPSHGAAAVDAGNTVTYTPAANWSGLDSFAYTISDAQGQSSTATVTVTVSPVDDGPPVAVADALTTDEGVSGSVNVLANDTVVDAPGAVVITGAPAHGGTGVSGGTITYTPVAGYFGSDAFTYRVTDSDGQSATAGVAITVNQVVDVPPSAIADALTTAEDAPGSVNVLANDTDPDGDPLAIASVTQGAHGAVAFAGGAVTYTPAANWNGSDAFTYVADDGRGGSSSATVTVTVMPVNDAPVALPDAAAVAEDGAVGVSVLANDLDVDGDPLSIASVTQGAHGTVAAAGGVVTYTPAANWNGVDSFTYTVGDGQGGAASGIVTVTVTPVNDPPVALADSATMAEDGAVAVSVLANDTDVDGDTLSVTAVTQGTHGAVALAGGVVTYTPVANWNGTDAFTYTASDGKGGTASATVTVTVSPVNDAPVAVADAATVLEDGSVAVSVLANDTDLDGDGLSIASVTQGAHGTVSFAGGVVTYTPAASWNGVDAFTYTMSDGNGGTATGDVTVTVTPVNDAPLAVADAATVAEDGAVSVSVLANDTDVDGEVLEIASVTQGAHGTVSFAGGVVTYTPSANWNGVDAFTYTVSDGNGGTASAGVTVTVTAVNDAPVAAADAATVAEDGAVSVSVLANDTDPDGDGLAVTAVTQGAHGSAAVTGGVVTYAPAAGWSGIDSFSYTISDGNGGTASASVTVTVTAIDHAPVAGADAVTAAEDGAVSADVLANDTDVDGDTLSVTAVTPGAHGSVALAGGGVTYTPAANWNGTDVFTYTIGDGNGGTATAAVTVTVTPVNDAPVALADALAAVEDLPGTIDVLANDSDVEGDLLTVESATQGAHGTVSVVGGMVTYAPAPNWNGTDSFTYTASDGRGGTATATVTVTVAPVNDAPVAAADSATVLEDGAVSVSVLSNDTDVDGDTLSLTAVTPGAHGSVSFTGGVATYTPASSWNGTDSFGYTISDGNGGTASGTVTVTVTPVNDDPVAVADSATVAEDGTVNVNVLANDTDPDGDALSIASATQGAHGAVSIAGGAVTYAPAANWNGTDSFTYTAGDGKGGLATATVTVTVTPVNDVPVAAADSAPVAEDASVDVSVLANDTDVDGDTLSIASVTQGAHGATTFAGGVVTYTPAADWNGTDSFDYTVSDGHGGSATATVTVTVTGANDPPQAADDFATLAEDGSAEVDVVANDTDADGDVLSITSVTQGAHGAVSFSGGLATYVPEADWNGSDSFDYTAEDGHGGSTSATVHVIVTPVDDPALAVEDAATVAEDAATGVNVAVLANDRLPDGIAASDPVRVASPPANGVVTVESDRSITYRPAADFNGTDSFTYEVEDADGDVATATVTVTVTPVNDAPVALGDALAVLAGSGPTPVDVLANDRDVDGDTLAVTAVSGGAHGDVVLAGGTVTYSPVRGYVGPDGFTYTIGDGQGGTATATVTVTASVDPAGTPVGAGDELSTPEDLPVTVDVLANDAGLRDGPITVAFVSQPAGGAAVVNGDGTITFTPPADASGTFTFTYSVTDRDGESAIAAVTITVNAVNDPPRAAPDAAAVTAGASVPIEVLANDVDVDGDPLTLRSVTQGTNGGTVTIDGARATYTAPARFTGTDSFTYVVEDGQGGAATGVVTIEVGTEDANGDGLRDRYGVAGGGCSSSGGGGSALLIAGALALLKLSPRRRRAVAVRRIGR